MSRTHLGWTLSEKMGIKTDMIGKGLSNGLSSLFFMLARFISAGFFYFQKGVNND